MESFPAATQTGHRPARVRQAVRPRGCCERSSRVTDGVGFGSSCFSVTSLAIASYLIVTGSMIAGTQPTQGQRPARILRYSAGHRFAFWLTSLLGLVIPVVRFDRLVEVDQDDQCCQLSARFGRKPYLALSRCVSQAKSVEHSRWSISDCQLNDRSISGSRRADLATVSCSLANPPS